VRYLLHDHIKFGLSETSPFTGHFERRISFGYDADLSQVRAEFDGEILRVIVPRRTPALTWYGGTCE
jgi:HSP20 family molecular chaperone IbpA